jgi:hypothetical protein
MQRLLDWFSLSRFFTLKSSTSTTESSSTLNTTTTSNFELNEQREKRKTQIMAVSMAITAMLVYAFAIGLIKIDIIKTDVEYIEKS